MDSECDAKCCANSIPDDCANLDELYVRPDCGANCCSYASSYDDELHVHSEHGTH